LYIPEHIPALPPNWESEWKDYSFVDLAVAIFSLFISADELSPEELRSLAEKSFQTFRHPSVAPLKRLDDKTFVLELFHGPTFAFKDIALQFLGNLFEFFLLRRNARNSPAQKNEKLTVVGATSGDTGRYVCNAIDQEEIRTANFNDPDSAAIYGLRNKANISIFILHPKGRVSPIQEAQMTTVTDKNVHNLAVKGTFDDCQVSLAVLAVLTQCIHILDLEGHRKSTFCGSCIQRPAQTGRRQFDKLGSHPGSNSLLLLLFLSHTLLTLTCQCRTH
jgi:threonine synthase